MGISGELRRLSFSSLLMSNEIPCERRIVAEGSVDSDAGYEVAMEVTKDTTLQESSTLHSISNLSWQSDTATPRDVQADAKIDTADASACPLDSNMTILQVDHEKAHGVFRMTSTPPNASSVDNASGSLQTSLDPLRTPRVGISMGMRSLLKSLAGGTPIDANDGEVPMTALPLTEPCVNPSMQQSSPFRPQNKMKTQMLPTPNTAIENEAFLLGCAAMSPVASAPKSSSQAASKTSTKPLTRRSVIQKQEIAQHLRARQVPTTTFARRRQSKSTSKRPRSPASEKEDSDKKIPPKKRRTLRDVPPGHIIGPASNQMQTVHQMFAYMQSTYTDTDLVEEIREMVNFCTERHFNGDKAYKNLPGAILDHALEILSPDEFIRVFELFRSSCRKNSPSAALPDSLQQRTLEKPPATASYETTTEVNVPEPSPVPSPIYSSYLPNLVEAGVGYGFHLASNLQSDIDIDLPTYLLQGAQTVVDMPLSERRLFWQYLTAPKQPPLPPSTEAVASIDSTKEGSDGGHTPPTSPSRAVTAG